LTPPESMLGAKLSESGGEAGGTVQRDGSESHLLRIAPFRKLLGGHAISSLGDWVATFGLMLFVRDLTRGSSIEGLAISGILGFRILPALLAAPIASTVTDRFDRRRTMITTDVVRAGLIAIVPFTPNLAAVYGIAFVLEGLSLVFLPARDAVVPNMVPRDKLAGANGLIMILQWGTIPLAGGLVVASDAASRALETAPVIGFLAERRFALPFFFDAMTFMLSAWAIYALPRAIGRVPRGEHTLRDEGTIHALEHDMMEGVRYLWSDHGRRSMMYGMALATGAGGALFAIGIPYVKTTLRASDSVFGALIVLWGVGMAGGAFISQRSHKRESELFRLALGGSGFILIFMAVFATAWLALGLSVAFGAGLAIAMVLGITVAQRTAPEDMRGRVMSAVHVLARVFLILGSVIVGGIAAAMGKLVGGRLEGWDGNRYALLIAGAALVAGGAAAKSGATEIEGENVERPEPTPNEASEQGSRTD
jgi:dTMP kinase